jgi:hypothetical protein
MTTVRRPRFDPRAILAALELAEVDYVLIGGLAHVLRGADVVTRGVDICPSFAGGNVGRLDQTVINLGPTGPRGRRIRIDAETLAGQPILRPTTVVGELGIVAAPAGIPNGYVELRRAATREEVGGSVRVLVASAGDLAAMAAALGRKTDLERLAMLRRMAEREAKRQAARVGPDRHDAQVSSRRSGPHIRH